MASVSVNSLVPMQLSNTKLKSYLTTPTDIIGITNAKEVVSVDYTLNGSCKGVVFATTTKAAIYDHTKAVCDRLKWSSGCKNGFRNSKWNGAVAIFLEI